MKSLSLILPALLTGCAGAPVAATPPVEVSIPVSVPCRVPAVQRPAFAVDALPLGAAIDSQMRALRAERHQRRAYEAELEAAVEVCR